MRWAPLAAVLLVAATTGADAKKYGYRKYHEHVTTMQGLAAQYPTLVKVETAQKKYDLKAVGSCPGVPHEQCLQHIVTLTNLTSLALETPHVRRPQIFISGTLHGNEWVGPTATVAAAEWMLAEATARDGWIRHLLNTRMTVIMPIANADGFAHSRREEVGIDPNRDFAFDVAPTKCMQTMAGRAINEAFREHIFRMAITFHGGANVIAYQWGDTKHCAGYPRNCRNGWTSSDHASMSAVGRAMSRYAGRSPSEGLYAHGACNDPKIIYPVHGGMEDWAYGASWHKSTATCSPKTHGGYPAEKTKYNNITHRMPNFLVETATRKKPPPSELGTDEDVMNVGGPGDGHVPRNIRLMLAGIDMLEPYLRVVAATADGADMLGGSVGAPRPSLPSGATVSVSWGVGGCWSVEATNILLQAVDGEGKVLAESRSPAQTGTCYWQQLGTNGKGPANSGVPAYTIPFTATAQVPAAKGAAHVVVSLEAKTDAKWQDSGGAEGDSPRTPQTHLVRARSDPTWYGRNGPYEVVGANGATTRIQRLPYCTEPPCSAAAVAPPAAVHVAPIVTPAAAVHPSEVGLQEGQMTPNNGAGFGRRSTFAAGATLAVAATHRWWLGLAGLGAVGVALRGVSQRKRNLSAVPLFGTPAGYTVEGVGRTAAGKATTTGVVKTSELEV